MNIYFICTGNTCRSPMAEAILKSKGIDGVHVRSAGISAFNGGEISANAKLTLVNKGISHHHTSSSVTAEDIEWADKILTMTMAHRQMVVSLYPQCQHKIYTLKEYVLPDNQPDILDPFGGDLAVYEETFNDLSHAIDLLIEKIVESKG